MCGQVFWTKTHCLSETKPLLFEGTACTRQINMENDLIIFIKLQTEFTLCKTSCFTTDNPEQNSCFGNQAPINNSPVVPALISILDDTRKKLC